MFLPYTELLAVSCMVLEEAAVAVGGLMQALRFRPVAEVARRHEMRPHLEGKIAGKQEGQQPRVNGMAALALQDLAQPGRLLLGACLCLRR